MASRCRAASATGLDDAQAPSPPTEHELTADAKTDYNPFVVMLVPHTPAALVYLLLFNNAALPASPPDLPPDAALLRSSVLPSVPPCYAELVKKRSALVAAMRLSLA